MGRIKTRLLKAVTKDIMEKHSDKLDTEFEQNKKVVQEHTDVSSKKLRNVIAGYATRLKKTGKY
jgi:small subunit ribosomal protein S17e